jgi:RNA recognition motif-containing protein
MNTQFQVVVPLRPSTENARTVLFISELPENITENELQIFFQDFKESIVMIQINKLNSKGLDFHVTRGLTATLIFKDHKRADEARKGLNLNKIRGKTIRIMWHEKDNKLRYGTQGNLFVKNIPFEIKPREIYEKFLSFGDIMSAKLHEDEEGNHNGYGYVSYYDPESAEKAIKALNNVEVWPGSKLEVAKFQKKNERIAQNLTGNKNLYVKNLPSKLTEDDLKELFGKHGKVSWVKIMLDMNNRKSAILTFESEESVVKAREALNHMKLDDQELYVDTLMKKSDRKKILSSRIIENNYKLNTQFKNCNLHLRNLPNEISEEELQQFFSSFGEVKSVKIPKFILVTKVKNEFKEIPMTKGFGYVCFKDQSNAKKAKDEMSGNFIPKYENCKRPLLIDFFMPKYERKQVLTKLQGLQNGYTGPKSYPVMNFNTQFAFQHPHLVKHIKNQHLMFAPHMAYPYENLQNKGPQGHQGHHIPHHQNHHRHHHHHHNHFNHQQGHYNHGRQHFNNRPQLHVKASATVIKPDDVDIKYLHSLEDDSAKKDYLGEFIFKKIENHPLAQTHNFTIDTIGKITGMILGIEDINEIVEITVSHENLTARITEALSLLGGSN